MLHVCVDVHTSSAVCPFRSLPWGSCVWNSVVTGSLGSPVPDPRKSEAHGSDGECEKFDHGPNRKWEVKLCASASGSS